MSYEVSANIVRPTNEFHTVIYDIDFLTDGGARNTMVVSNIGLRYFELNTLQDIRYKEV